MQIFSSLTDEQLVKSYVEGNNEAFDALLLRHQSKLFSYIMRIVRNRDIADDKIGRASCRERVFGLV